MRQIIKLGLGLILSSNAFSADPVEGVYLGLLGVISHAPNSQINFTVNNTQYRGTGTVGPVGGGFGISIGDKINNFRLEGELLINYNGIGEFQSGSCTLVSPNVLGPQGTCPYYINNAGLGFSGTAIGIYGLFNVMYDFLSSNPDNNMVPYIGLGLGAASIKTTAQVEKNQYQAFTTSPITANANRSNSGIAGQGIIGLGYYIDDFTTLGFDFRYLTTVNSSKKSNSTTINNSNSNNSRYGISTLNISATFALDKANK